MGIIDSFATGTGLGWDGMRPRLLRELGMPVADRVAAILSAWERGPTMSIGLCPRLVEDPAS
eukprot:9417319-Pyramimonas_sp.AAC.1